MILITVGTQEPFDRLISTIDKVAPKLEGAEIIAQVANSVYKPEHIQTFEFLPPLEFKAYFNKADLVISHAGMGTIISAMEYKKPLLVFPRLAKFGEHRNDHQLSTAVALDKLNYIHVSFTVEDLTTMILEIWNGKPIIQHKLNKYASPELISSIKNYISL